jgi:hypothetical protein
MASVGSATIKGPTFVETHMFAVWAFSPIAHCAPGTQVWVPTLFVPHTQLIDVPGLMDLI